MLLSGSQYGRMLLILSILGGMFLSAPSGSSLDLFGKPNPSLLYREAWRTAKNGMVYVDEIDGEDEWDEFLFWEVVDENTLDSIAYYDEDLQSIKTWVGRYYGNAYVYVTDLDALKGKEIIVSKEIKKKLFISLHSIYRDEPLDVAFPSDLILEDTDNTGSWEGSVIPYGVVDTTRTGTGYKYVICAVVCTEGQGPRGVYAFDIQNERTIWRYPTDANVENIILTDLDLNGVPEILCATSVPPEEKHVHSDLIVLKANGTLHWRIEPGVNLSGCLIATGDIDRNGISDVVLCTYSDVSMTGDKTREGINRITIYNGQGHPLRNRKLPANVSSLQLYDIVGDESLEIIVGTDDGFIHILDGSLAHIKSSKKLLEIDHLLIHDFNQDNNPEIIVSSHDPDQMIPYSTEFQTLILNTDLETIAQYSHGGRPFVLKGPQNRLLLLSDSELSILSMGIRAYAAPLGNLTIAIGLFVLLLFIVLALLLRKGRQQPILSRLREDTVNVVHFGIILLDAKGHILNVNKTANKLLGLEKRICTGKRYETVLKSENTGGMNAVIKESLAASTDSEKRKEIQLKIGSAGKEIFAEIVPLIDKKNKDLGRLIILQDVTELSNLKNIATWLSMARDMAHKIKNPLTPMKLALQRMQTVAQQNLGQEATMFDKYIEANLDEIHRLLKITDGFMKIIDLKPPQYQSLDINNIITGVLKTYEHSFSDRIKLHLDLAEDVPPIRADKSKIEDIVMNLLTNAVSAIETQGSINISTSYEQKFRQELSVSDADKCVWIEISDTGCGIPAGEIDKIFEPSYSRFEGGTGLGLATVKKLVEDHRGTIQAESQVGVGTKFAISFPVK